MSVDIFDRAQFEKVLGRFPLGYKLAGAETGQLEYVVPIASKVRCPDPECGNSFYLTKEEQCPKCGLHAPVSDTAVHAGEMILKIFSSIDPRTGCSRGTGEDSIRVILLSANGGRKLGHYITRVVGWEGRLLNKAHELWSLALRAPRCKRGHKATVNTCKSGQNKGRRFWKCWKCNQWLGWV